MGLIVKLFKERGIVTPDVPIVRNYNPGNYIRCGSADFDLPTRGPPLLTGGIKGFYKQYFWRTLEPQLGNYDGLDPVSGIVGQDLQWCQDNGVRLIVCLCDRTYSANSNPMPAYFGTPAPAANPAANPFVQAFSGIGGGNGIEAVRWNTTGGALNVRTRLKALIDAIGDQCDAHPAFEGFSMQETALGLSNTQKSVLGYTPAIYRDYYIDVLTYATTVLPHARLFFCFNSFPSAAGGHSNEYVDGVISGVEALNSVSFGGADALAENGGLNNEEFKYYGTANFTLNAVTCHGYKNRLPAHIQVSPPCYAIEWLGAGYDPANRRYWTMQELYDWMQGVSASHIGPTLSCAYVLWYPLNGNAGTADTDLGAPYPGWNAGLAPLGRTVVANDPNAFNYTGPK